LIILLFFFFFCNINNKKIYTINSNMLSEIISNINRLINTIGNQLIYLTKK